MDDFADWNGRYKTIIKVQTQPDDDFDGYADDLIVRIKVVDEYGNESNEVYFGNTMRVEYNGLTFKGKKMNWKYFKDRDNNRGNVADALPGRYIGFRSWGTNNKAKFFEVSLAGAEPAMKKVEVKVEDKKINFEFDEQLAILTEYKLTNLKKYFKFETPIVEYNGEEIITDIEQVDTRTLGLTCNGIDFNDNIIIKYQADDKLLGDNDDNPVKDFMIKLVDGDPRLMQGN